MYVLFMAQNIKPVSNSLVARCRNMTHLSFLIITHYGGDYMEELNYRFYILMILLPMLGICSIRSLRSIDFFFLKFASMQLF
jgi:hypothetical protein